VYRQAVVTHRTLQESIALIFNLSFGKSSPNSIQFRRGY